VWVEFVRGERNLVGRVQVCKKRRKKQYGVEGGVPSIKKNKKEKLGEIEAKGIKTKEG
jgi:hypothetical protein